SREHPARSRAASSSAIQRVWFMAWFLLQIVLTILYHISHGRNKACADPEKSFHRKNNPGMTKAGAPDRITCRMTRAAREKVFRGRSQSPATRRKAPRGWHNSRD